MIRQKQTTGFTIVELLVVIVVIAILAAIATIAYNGVRVKANETAIQAELTAAKKILLTDITISESYPTSLAQANGGKGLPTNSGIVYEYSYDNSVNPPTFCLTASKSGVSFYISNTGGISSGACSGHTVGGPVENPGNTFNAITFNAQTGAGTRNWRDVAMSADGMKIAAAPDGGYVQTSSDGGQTWQERTGSGSRAWRKIVSSDSGNKLAAMTNGSIYVSTDSGATWTTNSPVRSVWSSLDISGDGSNILAGDSVSVSGGLWRSSDDGATWTQTYNNTRNWMGMAISQDGMTAIASSSAYRLAKTTDGGASWTLITSVGLLTWRDVAISNSGTTIYAVVSGGAVYRSLNGGTSWTALSGPTSQAWYGVATSADGTKVVLTAESSGNVHTSNDSGANWTTHSSLSTGSWYGVDTSATGSRAVVTRYGNALWVGLYD